MTEHHDVIVIGGGAAGLMAAGQSAALGARTLLIEKMDRPGRKLLITGKGRCNLTNATTLDEFIPHFGPNGRFLYSAFHRFFNVDLIEFFADLGVETITERGERVFPVSNEAGEIVEQLERWVRAQGVTLWTEARVERLLVTISVSPACSLPTAHAHHRRSGHRGNRRRVLSRHRIDG